MNFLLNPSEESLSEELLLKKFSGGIHPKEFIGRTDAPSKWSKLRDFHQSGRLLGHRSMQTIRKWFEPVLHKRFGVSTPVSISWLYQPFAPANWLFMNLNWFELMSDIHWTNKYAWNWGWFGGCNGKLQFAADDLRLANSANLLVSTWQLVPTWYCLPILAPKSMKVFRSAEWQFEWVVSLLIALIWVHTWSEVINFKLVIPGGFGERRDVRRGSRRNRQEIKIERRAWLSILFVQIERLWSCTIKLE